MDKKGDLRFWVIAAMVALAAAVLILIIIGRIMHSEEGMIKSLIDNTWGKLNTTFGLMSEKEAAEHAKEAAKPIEHEELLKEAAEMKKILTDAAESLKKGNYDEAIKKYIEYYVECEKEYTPPGATTEVGGVSGRWFKPTCNLIKKEGAKFRLLNALRSKFYMLILKDSTSAETEYNRVLSLTKWPYKYYITKKEFQANYLLMEKVAKIEEGSKLKEVASKNIWRIISADYNEIYKLTNKDLIFIFFSNYDKASINYLDTKYTYKYLKDDWANLNRKLCADTKNGFSTLISNSDLFLGVFELEDKNKPLLKSLNYPFLSRPYSDITNGVCKGIV